MIERSLYSVAFSASWGRQMRFITGPRQCGKTTISRLKLEKEGSPELFYLWDLRSVRNRYKENQLFFTQDRPPRTAKQWICFDEMHKIPKWKNALKAIFDATSDHYYFIVTGSAKLDIFRKAGDSLSGRYFMFQLFPLSLHEVGLTGKHPAISPPLNAEEWIQTKMDSDPKLREAMENLLEYGGFPEPFLRQSKVFHKKWQEDYTDTVIKEDIGALTRILDKENLHDLHSILPEFVGSPLSESSLASHLEISNPTVKNHLKRLEDFYLAFRIHPYSRNIKRALLKAPKGYLYDWSRIQDPGKRFENYVAVELLSLLNAWGEISEDRYSLFYVRNKLKEETDFLILKNRKPWMLVETKLADSPLATHHLKTQAMLGGIPLVQLCFQEGVCQMQGKKTFRISASRFLG